MTMDKREKVIKGLECCLEDEARALKCWEDGDYPECPYNDRVDGCMGRLNRDALALLKAQEQKPISASIVDSDGGLMHWWACGNCQSPINPEDKFCHECGKAVKWE